ncbi:right-handed parallel beta-helix repeat-containing protein [Haloglomus halophilum]|uniref:right-handed parallel beta-helix repeat-containing protein n=1 Tax=Haloglomus halophilum TaxID=2962672 RepID=UPI0020C9673B|nr:right-handed parallel beta-helix repeat-containing protein [Haloglomus halophilum]
MSRRAYLGAVGVASASAAVVGTASAGGEYDEVVDIVEAGADRTGTEPIDDVFHEHAADDTRIEFPDGTYRVNQLIVYQLSNFAMVATGDATLVPGESYDEDQWIAGAETANLTIDGFVLDHTADGVAPEITLSSTADLTIRDIEKRGFHSGTGIAFAVQMLEGSDALIERVVAPDGGKCVGVYAHGEGSMTFRDCHLEGFTNNGLYASRLSGPARVEGGVYRDNNISQVRLGSPDSVVRDATLEVTRPVQGPDADVVNMRGVRVADGAGPVTVSNCDISMRGASGTGGIVTAYSGGSLEVYDTRIYIDEDYTTPSSDGDLTSWGVFVDDENGVDAGTRTFRNVSITGGGRYMSGMLLRRGDNTMDGLCIDQVGEGRNGIIFEDSANNTIADSVIDVPDEEIVLRDSSVKRAGVSTSGNCPAPGERTAGVSVPGEVGSATVEQAAAGEWHGVGFERQHEDPVVVSKPLSDSYSDAAPAHVRLNDVSADGFDLKVEEWLYLDGDHRAETAHYLALAAGDYTVDDLSVDVGRVRTNHEFSGFSFDQSFDQRPLVFAQCQTYEGPDPVVTRLRNVTADGAEVMVQEEEGEEHGGYHNDETVGYIAIEPGTGTVDDQPFEVGVADIHEEWDRIEFEQDYEDPKFVAGIQTFHGPNTANLRYRDLSASGVEVHVEEEQSQDEETLHRYERVGYAVFEGA